MPRLELELVAAARDARYAYAASKVSALFIGFDKQMHRHENRHSYIVLPQLARKQPGQTGAAFDHYCYCCWCRKLHPLRAAHAGGCCGGVVGNFRGSHVSMQETSTAAWNEAALILPNFLSAGPPGAQPRCGQRNTLVCTNKHICGCVYMDPCV